MTKAEKKEAVRKHNERYLEMKANPKSSQEQIREAITDVIKLIK